VEGTTLIMCAAQLAALFACSHARHASAPSPPLSLLLLLLPERLAPLPAGQFHCLTALQ
jgi:hypothetical protein